MPARKKKQSSTTARKKSSAKKKSGSRTKSTRASKSSGPLIKVARKIGTTLGEVNVAVRKRISKLGGGNEPATEE